MDSGMFHLPLFEQLRVGLPDGDLPGHGRGVESAFGFEFGGPASVRVRVGVRVLGSARLQGHDPAFAVVHRMASEDPRRRLGQLWIGLAVSTRV